MVLTNALLPADAKPKRTRVGVKQSKDGCFTCKTRRIKCDEEKPICFRCTRSNRICEGYRAQSTSDERASPSPPANYAIALSKSSRGSTPLSYSLYDGFRRTSEQDRLSQLGCFVLAHDRYDEGSGPGRSVWESLLPQLSRAIPAVNSAAAALGAAYELRLLSKNNDQSQAAAELQHSVALRTLQQDVASQPHGSVPLLLACVLLALAELLQRRQYNALMHFQGAIQILSSRHKTALEAMNFGRTCTTADNSPQIPDDAFDLMFQALDVQSSSYQDGRPPDLPASTLDFIQSLPLGFRSVREAGIRLMSLIHSCYHFTAKASEYKYLPRTAVPSELFVEQGRSISYLLSWLKTFDRDASNLHTPASPTNRHSRMLRAQCLVTIIYASTVMSPSEKTYDEHALSFQQIVENSAAALSKDREDRVGLDQFSPGPGVIQPLFFTALKYRHSTWRRRAIEMLRGLGREGPFDGKLLAAIATRAVEIEEAGLIPEDSGEIGPKHIPERYRLHGCAMDAEAREGKSMNEVGVRFSRCYNVEEMLMARVPWEDNSNWCMWEEALTL